MDGSYTAKGRLFKRRVAHLKGWTGRHQHKPCGAGM
jgi:hypothetical protein